MKKIENSPFDPFVKWLFPRLLPYIPSRVTANVISIMGLAASALACLCLYLTRWSPWMCLVAAGLVFLHWVADTLDGVVARARSTTHLGFYLDHFGDSLSVLFIGLGVFLIQGAHFTIGLVLIVLYLLFIISGLIKAELTRVMEIPAFGPTEIHLVVIVLLVAQPFVDFGLPVSWFPGFSGDDGWLTGLLGFNRGLTLVDLAGVIIVLAISVMLVIEITQTVRTLSRLDRG